MHRGGFLILWLIAAALPARGAEEPRPFRMGVYLRGGYDTLGGVSGGTDGALARPDTFGAAGLQLVLNGASQDSAGFLDWRTGWVQSTGLGGPGPSYLSADVQGKLELGRGRPWGLELTESLAQSDHPQHPLMWAGWIGLENQTRLRGLLRPTGQSVELGAGVLYERGAFGDRANGSSLGGPSRFNWNGVKGFVDATWTLPFRVTLGGEASGGAHVYDTTEFGNVNAFPARLLARVGWILVPGLRLSGEVGGSLIVFAQGHAPFWNTVGRLGLDWQPLAQLSLRAGCTRSDLPVGDDLFGVGNGCLLETEVRPFEILTVRLKGTADAWGFGTPLVAFNTFLGAEGRVDLKAAEWLHVLLGAAVSSRTWATPDTGPIFQCPGICLGVSNGTASFSSSTYYRLIADLTLATLF